MPGKNHRTWQTYHIGYFLTTVELDPASNARNVGQHKAPSKVTSQLIELMDSLRLPATWAASDPAHSAATSQIIKSAVPHEFAILGDASWLGPTAGRTRFARELSRRIAQARNAKLSVHTLVPRVASIESDVDLVVKHQITAVASIASAAPTARTISTPRALHYGVWEIPVTGKFPTKRGWFSSRGWSTWRHIRRVARDAETYHLAIDAPSLSDEGNGALNAVSWLLRRIAHLRDRGLVCVETLRQVAARLSDVPAVQPQQSILRRAA